MVLSNVLSNNALDVTYYLVGDLERMLTLTFGEFNSCELGGCLSISMLNVAYSSR